jgi:hypothetical protein
MKRLSEQKPPSSKWTRRVVKDGSRGKTRKPAGATVQCEGEARVRRADLQADAVA